MTLKNKLAKLVPKNNSKFLLHSFMASAWSANL